MQELGGLQVAAALFIAILTGACVDREDPPESERTSSNRPILSTQPTFQLNATGCRELLGFFPIPVTTARRFVPATYNLLGEDSGTSLAFVGLKECAQTSIDDKAIGPSSSSDVGVFIDKGDPDVFHYYQVWWYTDNPVLHEHLEAGEWRTGLSSDSLAATVSAPPGSMRFQVDGPAANYTLVGPHGGGVPGATNNAVGWHDTSYGTIRVTKTLDGSAQGGGVVTLTGDGEMARLVGASATGNSLWNHYNMVAQVH